jgi:hypothetical protein
VNDMEGPVVILEQGSQETEGSSAMSDESRKILEMLSEGKVTVDEAERLLKALGGAEEAGAGTEAAAPKRPKYLRVLVQDGEDNVNIRVPLGLVRAGMKLKSLLPEKARRKIEDKMGGIDISGIKPENIDEVLSKLGELHVDVDGGDGEKVRIFCE